MSTNHMLLGQDRG